MSSVNVPSAPFLSLHTQPAELRFKGKALSVSSRSYTSTGVEVMAEKHPCPIAACPNAEMWTDKDTYKAWKQRAAVTLLTDNSLTKRRQVKRNKSKPTDNTMA
ncbi:unnamed protein product [Pleuronectes platessa]|uniref:Uncharacterized protein n=1 Tax=Pleuronectes platessa TaxID=8262 RepID=A0A9N7YEZ1_PLEPL|nr:unnamed protein product [Pleuronectes platessa]